MHYLAKLAGVGCIAILAGNVNADDPKKALTDSDFVDMASTAIRAEVAAGRIAVTRAHNEEVKKFAALMAEQHAKANNELLIIVSDARIAIPEKLTAEQEKLLAHFQSGNIKDFDKEYMKHIVDAHEKAVSACTKAAKECKNEKVKAFAEKSLPILKEHLAMAKKINEQLK